MPLFSDPAAVLDVDCQTPEYCHIFFPGDFIYGQWYQTPCGDNLIADPLFGDFTLGAELVTNGDFTGNANSWTVNGVGVNSTACPATVDGWCYNTNKIGHDGTGVLTDEVYQAIPALTLASFYQVVYTVSGRTQGSIYAQLGDGPGATQGTEQATNATFTEILYFNDDKVLGFFPSADFDGNIDDVSVKLITYSSWTVPSEWILEDSKASKRAAGTGILTESVAAYTTANGYYSLTFTITDYVSGTLVPKVAGVVDQDASNVSANGTYTFYFDTGVTGVVSFEPSSDFIGSVSAPDLRALRNDYLIEVRDSNSQFLYYEITPTYYHEYVTIIWDITAESEASDPIDPVTFGFGCYLLNVYDFCILEEEMIVNGTLTGGSGTTPPTGWFALPTTNGAVDWSGNQFEGTVNAAGANPRFRNTTPFAMTAGNYELSFEIISIDPGLEVQATIDNGSFSSSMFTTVGVKTFTINNYDPDTDFVDGFIRIFVSDNGGPYPASAVIDNVSLVRIEPFSATYRSDCWQYMEINQATRLFQGYSDHNALGFEFVNTGFRLSERLKVRSFGPSYEVDRKVFNYGSGNSGVYYAEFTKWTNVHLDAVPETVHDTMAVMMNADHFLIGPDEYQLTEYTARGDDYSPDWNRSGQHNLATARFDVKPKEEGQVFNRDC
jgi:hypothetical protein